MTESHDIDTLKQIAADDQQSEAQKAQDRAVMRCAVYTANHYRFLTLAKLPEHLVDRLTLEFQESYLEALFGLGVQTVQFIESEDE